MKKCIIQYWINVDGVSDINGHMETVKKNFFPPNKITMQELLGKENVIEFWIPVHNKQTEINIREMEVSL